jgi:hypothetical protein
MAIRQRFLIVFLVYFLCTFIGYAESASPDTTPDPFTLNDLTGQPVSTSVTSNAIIVSGIDTATAISIAGGLYSINGGVYTSAVGTVNNGDSVTVRLTASENHLTSVDAILTIGGVSDAFVVTTDNNVSVSSSNAVISDVTVTDSVTGFPANYTPVTVVSFKATGVVSTANFSIKYSSLPRPAVFYKVVNGEWKQLYPTNQSICITNIVFSYSDYTLSFTIADNSACDGDSTVGVISDPIVVGSEMPTTFPIGIGALGMENWDPCFIATAAWGSHLDPHVRVLRDFRDHYLITNSPGRAFVDYYYSISPPIADYIQKHESLRSATRFILTPVVYGLEYPWLVLICGGVIIGMWGCKKRLR